MFKILTGISPRLCCSALVGTTSGISSTPMCSLQELALRTTKGPGWSKVYLTVAHKQVSKAFLHIPWGVSAPAGHINRL